MRSYLDNDYTPIPTYKAPAWLLVGLATTPGEVRILEITGD